MAIIAVRKSKMRTTWRGGNGKRRRLSVLALTTLASASTLVALSARPGAAQTTGTFNGVVSGAGVLFDILGTGALIQPGSTATPPALVDFGSTGFGYIKGPQLAVVQGIAGSYSVNYGTNLNITYNNAGMLSFGNIGGAFMFTSDNLFGLNGRNQFDFINGGKPAGYGVWPLASHWQSTGAFVDYDYSAYTRVQIDGTTGTPVNVPILGATGLLYGPVIDRGPEGLRLRTIYDIGTNIQIEQQISLYHQQAKIRWLITNTDTAAGHSVALRFTVCNRGALQPNGPIGQIPLNGFFFVDPTRGVSNETTLLQGANIPDELNIYGKRYEPDDPADPPFAARHTFRGYGASQPTQVYITDPFELRPEEARAQYIFGPGFLNANMRDGIAVATYFGPYNLQPGAVQEVITYYGNGVPNNRLDNDFVVSAEGVEALGYNAVAAVDPAIAGQLNNDQAAVGSKFLTPNPFRIYGSLYNRTPKTPATSVNLDGTKASLVLPQGLRLAVDPTTGQLDTAEKLLGNNGQVQSDEGASTSWFVEPTGTVYGTLTYQVSFQTRDYGSKQINRSITIPATPFKSVTGSVFQMIGFPFAFDPVLSNNGDPATVINGLSSPANRDEPVALYHWDPTIQDYGGPVSQLTTGIGYFYRPNFTRTFYAKGVQPVPGQATPGDTTFTDSKQVQITLQPGWNMISNPYLYGIPLKLLRFVPTQNNPNLASQTFAQAISSNLVRGGVFFFDTTTSSYDFLDNLDELLRPWDAYWLFVNNPVTLIYPLTPQRQAVILPDPGGAEPPTRKRGAIASGRAFAKTPTPDNWALHIKATRGGSQVDSATIIGVTKANEPESSRQVLKPPVPVKDYVYVGVVKPNVTGRFAKDLQTGAGVKTWNLEVISDQDGPVSLTWPNIGTMPRLVNLSVKDEASGRTISLRSSSSFQVNVRKGQPTRLVLTAKAQSSQPLMISNLRATSSGGRAEGTRGFTFNVNREATVTLTVETITGKQVGTVVAGRAVSAGENRFSWAGRAQSGAVLPPGPYMVKITARAGDSEAPVTVRVPFTTLQ